MHISTLLFSVVLEQYGLLGTKVKASVAVITGSIFLPDWTIVYHFYSPRRANLITYTTTGTIRIGVKVYFFARSIRQYSKDPLFKSVNQAAPFFPFARNFSLDFFFMILSLFCTSSSLELIFSSDMPFAHFLLPWMNEGIKPVGVLTIIGISIRRFNSFPFFRSILWIQIPVNEGLALPPWVGTANI